jgi:hypothetical protein
MMKLHHGHNARKVSKHSRKEAMRYRSSTAAFALAAALITTMGGVQADDDAKYPDWSGQ